jgi:hypothetical protein
MGHELSKNAERHAMMNADFSSTPILGTKHDDHPGTSVPRDE